MKIKLGPYIKSGQVVRLHTKHPENTGFDCIVLSQSKELVIIQELTDFEPDGVVVLPISWLRGVRDTRIEKCATAVVRHDPTLKSISKVTQFATAADLKDLISRLHQQDVWPAVEIVYKGKGIVYLGRITVVSEEKFQMRSYSAEGKWLEEVEFDYSEIFKVEIESRYASHFNSYMRAKKLKRDK